MSDSGTENRYEWLFMAMADGVVFAEELGDDVVVNAAARRLLGIPTDIVVTRAYLKEDVGFYPFELLAGQLDDTPLREELRVGDRTLHSLVSPVRNREGDRIGVVAVLRDFTDLAELATRQDEFVSVVSHELRTPLTSIAGALDLALANASDMNSRQRRYLELARESTTKLGVIVDDLLDVARAERGRMPVSLVPMALDDLARQVTERFRPAASSKQIDLKLSCTDYSVRIAGDPERLTQVLNNLLANAIKFTPEGGDISVDVFGPSIAASHVGVSVFNSGEPVSDEAKERIFDKFEQSNNNGRVGGSGLGLAISRGIVEAHGGRIWVEAHPEGSKFIFTLPASPNRRAETVQDVMLSSVVDVSGAARQSAALVVDDDRHSAYIVKGILMANGMSVEVCHDAETALQKARQTSRQLVVIDSGLEDRSGLDLIDILAHDPDTRGAKTVVVSNDDRDREDALRAGADEYVVRPLDPNSFGSACARLVHEGALAEARRVLVIDDQKDIRTVCRGVLENAGYRVRSAKSGASGLIEARSYRPDLILLDVNMPELDGFEAASRFRAEPTIANTPIIFLSARGETHDKVRAFRLGAQDYIVKPFNATELVLRVKNAIDRRDRELGASPTTKLPGGEAIEREIRTRLDEGDESAAFCYLDLDNLKAFNDYYGYAKADAVIRQTGDLIRHIVAEHGTAGDFIGHIAGDDFVFVTTTAVVDRVCAGLCERFDQLIPYYYRQVDRDRGHIRATDRYGEEREFPIMRVSIAVVTQKASSFERYSGVASAAAEGKTLAKAQPASSYIRDGKVIVPSG